jgi:choice-of-anchor A domain-containing protein
MLEKTGTFRVGSGPCSTLGIAAGFNAIIFGNFDATGGDTEGRLAVAGDLTLHAGYSVNIAVRGENVPTVFGSGTDSMIAGGNLNDGIFGVNGNIVYGGVRTGGVRYMPNGNLLRQVVPVTLNASGNVPGDGTGATFEDLLNEMEIRSALFAAIEDRGVSVKEMTTPHELSLIGTDPDLNVFNLTHDQWSLSQSDIIISAPSTSTVLVNVHGGPIVLGPGAMRLTGVTANRILVNYVDAEEITQTSFLLEGSVIAPYANGTFTGGGIDGTAVIGGDVVSMQGFEFHNFPFRGQICLEVFYEFTVTNVGNVTVEDIRIDDPLVTVDGGPITLNPGESDDSTFTGLLKVEPQHVVDGRIVNIADVSGQPPLGKPRVTAEGSDEQSFTIPGIGSGGRTPPAAPVAPPAPGPEPEAWQKADFTVEFVKFRNLNPVSGDKFQAVVRVTNDGHKAGDAGTLKGWAHRPAQVNTSVVAEKSIPIGVLNPGESRKMTLRRLEVPADVGFGEQNLQFRAFVDATGTDEYSIGNNQMVEGYAVQYADSATGTADWMKPDFEIQSVELLPSPTITSSQFDVRVRIKNIGYAAGDAGTLSFWQASPSYTNLPTTADETVALGTLAVDEVKEITFSTLTAPAVQGTYHARVRVDSAGTVAEMSEGNNDGGATYTVFPLSITITPVPTGNEISWKGTPGFRYTVERSTGLGTPFIPIEENIPASMPTTRHLDDDVPPGAPVFYRVWGIR